MFTEAIHQIEQLRGQENIPPHQLLDVLKSAFGQCQAELKQRGPVRVEINGTAPEMDGQAARHLPNIDSREGGGAAGDLDLSGYTDYSFLPMFNPAFPSGPSFVHPSWGFPLMRPKERDPDLIYAPLIVSNRASYYQLPADWDAADGDMRRGWVHHALAGHFQGVVAFAPIKAANNPQAAGVPDPNQVAILNEGDTVTNNMFVNNQFWVRGPSYFHDFHDYAGTVTSATTNTLTDTSQTFTNVQVGTPVTIVDGTGAQQTNYVLSVDGDTITFIDDWSVTPDSTSDYIVGGTQFVNLTYFEEATYHNGDTTFYGDVTFAGGGDIGKVKTNTSDTLAFLVDQFVYDKTDDFSDTEDMRVCSADVTDSGSQKLRLWVDKDELTAAYKEATTGTTASIVDFATLYEYWTPYGSSGDAQVGERNIITLADTGGVPRGTEGPGTASFDFDGTSDLFSVTTTSFADFTQDFSVALWFHMDRYNHTSDENLFACNTDGLIIGVRRSGHGTNPGELFASVKQASGTDDLYSGQTIANSTLYFMVWTWDADALTQRIYLNAATPDSSTASDADGGLGFILHVGAGPSGGLLDGEIALPMLFRFKLTDAQVTWLYNSGSGRVPPF